MKRVVAGIHSVSELLKIRPKTITELWLREGDLNPELQKILEIAQKYRLAVKRTSNKALEREVQSHQGVIAHAGDGPQWPTGAQLSKIKTGFIYALDGFEDPHNVGSILRTAWNLGCLGLIISKDRSASAGSGSAQKVASGGFEHVPVLEIANLSAELKSLKEFGFWVYGLEMSGSKRISKIELAPKSILVIGSEESGLRKPVQAECDELIHISQTATSNSYNAAVSGALAGYEFRRQHEE